jgi:hypothetical protein
MKGWPDEDGSQTLEAASRLINLSVDARVDLELSMATSWESATGGSEFVCESCGALYSVEVRPLQVQDPTVANCEVCGAVMVEWNSALRLTFLLRERPRQDEIPSPSRPPLANKGEKKGAERSRRRKKRDN